MTHLIPPPGPPVTLCRAPGWCCQSRRCAVLAWTIFVVCCLVLIAGVALVIVDGETIGYGLD